MSLSRTLFASLVGLLPAFATAESPKPLMRDFIGLNAHTVQFDPALYQPVCRLVRDFHPYHWDVNDKVGADTHFPTAMAIGWKAPPGKFRDWKGLVDWNKLYSSWTEKGFEIDVCVMFDGAKFSEWPDAPRDAYKYGLAFGKAFGPGTSTAITSVEIGNEPASNNHYSAEQYKVMLTNMARGIRESNPKLKIVSAAVDVKPDGFCSDINVLRDAGDLYDVINLHKYAVLHGWPSWERTYPENPNFSYLKDLQASIDWRDQNAPGKQVWLTEFGFDSSTQKPDAKNAQWKSCTDLQQAQWIVRSFLAFAQMDMDRAYLYFFNDSDKPSFHAASGITRNYEPKPSYWALSHLSRVLGDYRLSRVVEKQAEAATVLEFVNGEDPNRVVWVAWSATGDDRKSNKQLTLPGKLLKAEQMPTTAQAKALDLVQAAGNSVEVPIEESPVYLLIQK